MESSCVAIKVGIQPRWTRYYQGEPLDSVFIEVGANFIRGRKSYP